MKLPKPKFKANKKPLRKYVSLEDIRFLFLFPILALSSFLMNEVGWFFVSKKISKFCGGLLSRSPKKIEEKVKEIGSKYNLTATPMEISNALVANEIETKFQIIRCHLPFHWKPKIVILGEDHIKLALDKKNGAILWDSHFSFSSIVTKIGLHRAGYDLHHLSRQEHGFSTTSFGVKYINPIRTSIECHYLKERIIIQSDNPSYALNNLAERLKNNAVISITVRGTANRPILNKFLGGWLKIAPGAVVLALKTGAQLIPVFTIRHQQKLYHINVGEPINVSQTIPKDDAIKEAMNSYVTQLEPFVVQYPDQWIDWINI